MRVSQIWRDEEASHLCFKKLSSAKFFKAQVAHVLKNLALLSFLRGPKIIASSSWDPAPSLR
jgi:hypothetical protein